MGYWEVNRNHIFKEMFIVSKKKKRERGKEKKEERKKERERKRERDLAHTASGQFALAWSFGSNAWGERTAGAIACASVVAFQ